MTEFGEAPRLLLVEAHDGLRLDLARALEASGYRVDAVGTPEQLPTREARPRYAIFLLDAEAFQRPGHLEFVEPVPGRTLWMLDGASPPLRAALGIDSDAAVVTKPFSIHALEARIVGCLLRHEDPSDGLHDPVLHTREPGLGASLVRARRWAGRDVAIVLEGELGTGRRALAGAIHGWSPRRREPTCLIDRAEVEAVGSPEVHEWLEKLWVSARKGSLLIAEPADWPHWAQQALVAVLRSSGEGPRLIAWTREPLEQSVEEGRLVLELQYRLDGVRIALPALRDRPLDHLALCTAVARRVARALGRSTPIVDSALVERLARDGFPGNRIGLESRLRSALIRSDEGGLARAGFQLDAEAADGAANEATTSSLDLKTLERDTIVRALAHWQGNRTRASESLGISVRTLRNKIREYALR